MRELEEKTTLTDTLLSETRTELDTLKNN